MSVKESWDHYMYYCPSIVVIEVVILIANRHIFHCLALLLLLVSPLDSVFQVVGDGLMGERLLLSSDDIEPCIILFGNVLGANVTIHLLTLVVIAQSLTP